MIAVIFILVGVYVVLARRRSFAIALYIITTATIAVAAVLMIITLEDKTYLPLGSTDRMYKLLRCHRGFKSGSVRDRLSGNIGDRIYEEIFNLLRTLTLRFCLNRLFSSLHSHVPG